MVEKAQPSRTSEVIQQYFALSQFLRARERKRILYVCVSPVASVNNIKLLRAEHDVLGLLYEVWNKHQSIRY